MLDYDIEYISLPDLDAAIEYVLERQEGKRNATPQDISYSRGKLYGRRKKKMGGTGANQHTKEQSAQNEHSADEGKTADEVGKDTGAGQATTRRDAEYSRAVDALTKVFGRDFQAHVLSGESTGCSGRVEIGMHLLKTVKPGKGGRCSTGVSGTGDRR